VWQAAEPPALFLLPYAAVTPHGRQRSLQTREPRTIMTRLRSGEVWLGCAERGHHAQGPKMKRRYVSSANGATAAKPAVEWIGRTSTMMKRAATGAPVSPRARGDGTIHSMARRNDTMEHGYEQRTTVVFAVLRDWVNRPRRQSGQGLMDKSERTPWRT